MTRAGKEASGGGQLSWPDPSSWAAHGRWWRLTRKRVLSTIGRLRNPTRAGFQPAFCAGGKQVGLPRHPRVPSPQAPGARGLPKARRATRQERDEGPPSGGFLWRSHTPTFSRLRAQCLPGLGERKRPPGMGWEGRTARDEGRVPCDTRHPDARAHGGWGLYRAGSGQTRGSWGHRGTGGPSPDLISAKVHLPQPLRAGVQLAVLA